MTRPPTVTHPRTLSSLPAHNSMTRSWSRAYGNFGVRRRVGYAMARDLRGAARRVIHEALWHFSMSASEGKTRRGRVERTMSARVTRS